MSNISFFDFYKKNKENSAIDVVSKESSRIVKLSREQIFNNLFQIIASFKKMHGENLLIKISSSEWKLFFNVIYKHFLENGIIANYPSTMEFLLQYVLSFPAIYQEEGLSLNNLVNNIDMPLMLCRVPSDVSTGIKEELNDAIRRIKPHNRKDDEHNPFK